MPSVQIMAVWLLIALLCGYFVYLRFLAESENWGRPTRFHGIQGISQELERIVERLATGDLPNVVDAALESSADDFADDADVQHAIATYRTDRPAARMLAEKLALKANLCDSAYIRLEEAGRKDESAANFRKMCVLNGLSPLLASKTLTEKVADDLIYNLGHGARDADLFARKMIAKLKGDNDLHATTR